MTRIPANYRRLEGSELQPARDAHRVGPVGHDESITITLCVRQRPGTPPLSEHGYWMATPSAKRRFLSFVDARRRRWETVKLGDCERGQAGCTRGVAGAVAVPGPPVVPSRTPRARHPLCHSADGAGQRGPITLLWRLILVQVDSESAANQSIGIIEFGGGWSQADIDNTLLGLDWQLS